MSQFFKKNQGKISFKMAVIGLAMILVLVGSGFSITRFVKNISQEKDLTAGLPLVFAADESAIFKIDLDQIDLEQSEIDITGPDSPEKFDIVMVLLDNGQYELKVKPKKPTVRPGRYTVSAKFVTPDGIKDYSQDFYWGVLALNTNKSVYLPDEMAYLQMAVLDDEGDTICDAELELKVKEEKIRVIRNPQCGPNNVIDTPDYYAYYQLGEPGNYQVELIAQTENGPRSIKDLIEVKESLPYEVERIGPTRIYPFANYQMKFIIKANQDFKGEVVEKVPTDFGIAYYSWSETTEEGKVEEQTVINMSSKVNSPMVWPVDWQTGQTYQLSYTFDAPDISPEFYLLGPLNIGSWQEARHWQIAADAIDVYNYTPSGSCTDPNSAGWADVGNACDSPTDDTHASRDVPNAENDSTTYILANGNNAPAGNGIISVVEIGVECHTEKSVNSTIHLIPVFNGTTDGTGTYNFLNVNTADDDVTQYFTITDDPNAPGTWSWSDVENLDIKVYSSNDHGTQARLVYIDQIRVRVTHDPSNAAPIFNSVTDDPDIATAGQVVTFSVSWDDDNGDAIKAKICKTPSLTDQNCDGGFWASTTSQTHVSDDPENVTYTTTASDFGSNDYYAYICDDGGGGSGLCSSFLSGSFSVGGVLRVKGDVRVKGGVRVKKY